jgi:hypothetical protein
MFNAERNDSSKVNGGVWRELMGASFLIARAGNSKYLAAQERHGKRQAATAEERQERMCRAIAEGILLDWDEEVKDRNKTPIPYSVDNAAMVLMDNPDLLSAVLAEANDFELYRREDHSQQAKKPQKSSGSS